MNLKELGVDFLITKPNDTFQSVAFIMNAKTIYFPIELSSKLIPVGQQIEFAKSELKMNLINSILNAEWKYENMSK